MSKTYKFETIQIHEGQESPDPYTDARAVPIYATTSYVFQNANQAAARFSLQEDGNIYTRLMNPTSSVFEERMAALEGGVGALATASGSAAIDLAIRNIAKAGDHIVSSNSVYGGTFNLFANTLVESGITTTFVDGQYPDQFRQAIQDNTKAIYLESLGNPNSDIIDLEAVSEIAHEHGIPVIVDNTFATPYLFQPLKHGADIVVHSATKFIGGHGTVMGGVIIDGGTFDWNQNNKFPGITKPNPSYHGIIFHEVCGNLAYIMKIRTTLMRDQGACISPFHSFLLLQGLETLSLRVERHVENALKVVDYLAHHPMVKTIHHPSLSTGKHKALYDRYYPNGGASIFTFEVNGTSQQAKKFSESMKLFSLLANVADVKSLVIHPASTTHSQMNEEDLKKAGITPTTIRLSIGTEHIDDIIEDIEQALEKIQQI